MDREDFGQFLRRLRLDAGLTQTQLARETGLSVRTISNLEHGNALPRLSSIERLAEGLRLTPQDTLTFRRAARDATPGGDLAGAGKP